MTRTAVKAALAAILLAAGVRFLLSATDSTDPPPSPAVNAPATPTAPSVALPSTGTVHLEVFPAPPDAGVTLRLFRAAPPRATPPWNFEREVTIVSGAIIELEAGPWLATATSQGASASGTVEVLGGEHHWVSLALERTRQATLTVLEEKTRIPVEHARAELIARWERSGFPTFLAGKQWTAERPGFLRLDALPSGQVALRVSAPTHLPTEVMLSDESATVVLEPASWVEGTVRDENGTPLAGATVRGSGLEAATTDATGTFRLATPPGDVLVTALDPAGRSKAVRVNVAPTATVRGLELQLGDPLILLGRVVDALTETPVAGARIVAELPHNGPIVASAVSGAAGRFQLDGVPPGWVIVTAALGRGAMAIERSVPTEGGTELLLRLSPAAAVTGQVRDETGRLMAHAEVQLTSLPSGDVTRARANSEGAYRFEDVPPGVIRLRAAAGDTGLSHDERSMLTAGAVTRIDLTIRATGTIEGRVSGEGGPWVVLASAGEGPSSGSHRIATHSDGRFTLVLPTGRWALSTGLPHGAIRFTGAVATVEAGGINRIQLDAPPEQSTEEAFEELAAFAEPGTLGLTVEERGGAVIVGWIGPRTPAAMARLREGDVLMAIDGHPVQDASDAYQRLRGEPGSMVQLRIRSSSGTRELAVGRQRKGRDLPP